MILQGWNKITDAVFHPYLQRSKFKMTVFYGDQGLLSLKWEGG